MSTNLPTGHVSEMAAFDNIQAELDKIQQMNSAGAQASTVAQSAVGAPHLKTIVVSNSSGSFVQGTSLLANSQANQVVFSSNNQQHIAQALKRPSSGQAGPTVAKVIIRGTGKQQIVQQIGGNQTMAGNTILVSSLNQQSPTKTITISAGSLGSPQRLITSPATPTKQIVPLSRLPMSPMKTPPKITMIPVSLGKSPQRPSAGQMVTMLSTKSANASDSRPTTITMSPSRVLIKGQPVTMQSVQQVVNASQAGATSVMSHRPQGPMSSGIQQPVSVSGSKFQYVRLVTAPASGSQTVSVNKPTAIHPTQVRSIMPNSAQGGNLKIAMPPLHGQVKAGAHMAQRVILPATGQVPIQPSRPQSTLAQIRPAPGSSQLQQIGNTTAINLQNFQNVQGFALVPTNQLQYVTQLPTQTQTQTVKQENYVPISTSGPPPAVPRHTLNGSAGASSEAPGQRPRKPCNCTKSQCLKLYCDCFANGEFCNNCNCNNCANNLEHEDERSRAIKACLERNPLAFHPKIGKGKGRGEGDRRHNKGCNCKRSGCLKNYCECYEAKIMCSNLCKCVGCKNFEESPDRKTLMHLADAAEVRVQQQTAAKSKLSSQIAELPPRPAAPSGGERLPFTFVTKDVAEATCACLVAQAEEAERTRQIEMVCERMILEEFGRCLMQVIESANRTKAPSPVP